MAGKSASNFEFGEFRLDPAEQTLHRGDERVALTPKAFETLVLFLENPGRLVQKTELMESLWPDRFVEEGNLTFHIGMLRKALGDDAADPRYIETVPRRGYRFIAPVVHMNGSAVDEVTASEGNASDVPTNGRAYPAGGVTGIFPEVAVAGPDSELSEPSEMKTGGRPPDRKYLYAAVAVVLVLAGAAGSLLWRRQPSFYDRIAASGFLIVEKMSDTGQMTGAAVSADGKLLVYHTDDGGRSTMWLRQAATGNSVPLLTLKDEFFSGHGFSGDGEFIYYTHQPRGGPLTLSRVPTLGGTQKRILDGLHGGWSFSPDEKHLVFTRFAADGTRLFIADAEGGNEREILFSPRPRNIFGAVWSPDGKTIAYCVGGNPYDRGGAGYEIVQLNLATGDESPLSLAKWNFVESLEWLPDQSGLLAAAKEKNSDVQQIWLISNPGGKATRITFNADPLSLRGASADLGRILATEKRMDSQVWVAPADDPTAARPIGTAEWDVTWTKDGQIVYPTRSRLSRSDLWIASGDGDGRRQLTASDIGERAPIVSGDGRYIVYVASDDDRQNLWRMNADGMDHVRLTDGDGESFPAFTPDGEWIVYTAAKTGSLWKVRLDGREAQPICEEKIQRAAISPDGKLMAHIGRNKDNKRLLIIRSFADCSAVKEFEAAVITASAPKVAWSRDGRSVLYALDDASYVGNLWQQPLDGGEPKKLTNFTSEQLFDFAFSPDGKQIAFVRGEWHFDAVLVKGLKP